MKGKTSLFGAAQICAEDVYSTICYREMVSKGAVEVTVYYDKHPEAFVFSSL